MELLHAHWFPFAAYLFMNSILPFPFSSFCYSPPPLYYHPTLLPTHPTPSIYILLMIRTNCNQILLLILLFHLVLNLHSQSHSQLPQRYNED